MCFSVNRTVKRDIQEDSWSMSIYLTRTSCHVVSSWSAMYSALILRARNGKSPCIDTLHSSVFTVRRKHIYTPGLVPMPIRMSIGMRIIQPTCIIQMLLSLNLLVWGWLRLAPSHKLNVNDHECAQHTTQ